MKNSAFRQRPAFFGLICACMVLVMPLPSAAQATPGVAAAATAAPALQALPSVSAAAQTADTAQKAQTAAATEPMSPAQVLASMPPPPPPGQDVPEATRIYYNQVMKSQMDQLRTQLAPVPASPRDIIQDDTKHITDQYNETTFPNLARMYWAVGKFDDRDNDVIDNYLLITECKLYQQYYSNDFVWGSVRKSAREFIRQYFNRVPLRYEAMIPIQLGKYDVDKSEFEVLPESQMNSTLRIEVVTNEDLTPVCNRAGSVPGYPRNVIVILNRPFSFQTVPVDPRIAQLYIQDTRVAYQNKTGRGVGDDYKRVAWLRLKLRMLQFKDEVRYVQSEPRAEVYAVIEGWDVFADEAEQKPMYSFMYKKNYMPPPATFQGVAARRQTATEYVPSGVNDKPGQ